MISPRIKNIYAFSLLGLLFLIALIFINGSFIREKEFYFSLQSTAIIDSIKIKEKPIEQKPIILMFVGDIMLDRGVEYMIQTQGNEDYKFPFLEIADYLNKADILFGNLESVISDKGVKVGSIYSFRADPKAIEGLVFAGFDVLSMANNHIFDYGRAAMEDSFRRLKKAGIDYVGGGFSEKEACSPVIKEVDGTKIAYLAYTNLSAPYWIANKDRSGITLFKEEKIKEDIKKAKAQADLVVVSVHTGDEYQTQPNIFQKTFFRQLIDKGADLVIGHHPHVVQPVEEYESGYIAYSLGNFVFDQGFSEQTMKGLLLEVLVKNGKIVEVIPRSVKINQYFQPELLD